MQPNINSETKCQQTLKQKPTPQNIKFTDAHHAKWI